MLESAGARRGSGKESNWLPAPAGKFILMFRFYRPKDAIYDLAGAYALGSVSGVLDGTTDGETSPACVVPGFAVAISNSWQFELGVPVGLNSDSAGWGLTALLSITWN